jgi:hypothetical protein
MSLLEADLIHRRITIPYFQMKFSSWHPSSVSCVFAKSEEEAEKSVRDWYKALDGSELGTLTEIKKYREANGIGFPPEVADAIEKAIQ